MNNSKVQSVKIKNSSIFKYENIKEPLFKVKKEIKIEQSPIPDDIHSKEPPLEIEKEINIEWSASYDDEESLLEVKKEVVELHESVELSDMEIESNEEVSIDSEDAQHCSMKKPQQITFSINEEKESKKTWKEGKCAKIRQARIPEKKLIHMNRMSILSPHMKGMQTTHPLHTSDLNNHEETDEESSVSEGIHPVSSEIQLSTSYLLSKSQRKIQKKITEEKSLSVALMKYILDNNEKNTLDDVDLFLPIIGQSLKLLPLKERLMAKAELFNVVSKFEIKYLTASSHSNPANALPT